MPVGKKKLSFLGVVFDTPIVARVRIEYGNRALGPDKGPRLDAAVMDDFIYGSRSRPRPVQTWLAVAGLLDRGRGPDPA